ncbi:MAG: glycoside hydrolase family 27 protein [Planctomycetes bacterium]|nr:glycoside hydrolase family 27 protein [Planctomycetota bacterium]
MTPIIDRRQFISLTTIAALSPGALAARKNNRKASSIKLALKPPLGWNSFDCYGVYLHEKAALANIEAMAEKLKPFGYEYFVVDNGWFGEYKLIEGTIYAAEKHASDVNINEYGLLQPSKTYFPNGLKHLIDRTHELGLKFGVHLMRGIPRKAVEMNLPIKGTKYRAADIADTSSVCRWCDYNYGVNMDKPGAQQFYNSLVDQLAGWGIDYIKADDIVPYPKEVEGLAQAVAQCGRPIVLSLSPGGSVDPDHIESFRTANLLRVTSDIWDEVKGINECFDAWRKWQGKEQPGFWIDMDMIPFGKLALMAPPEYVSAKGHGGGEDAKEGLVALSGKGTTRWSLFTRPQMYTFITMRALAASPLMVGGDLPTMDDFSLSLMTDPDMLECNQNGVMGHKTFESGDTEIWVTPQKRSSGKGWIGVFNRSDKAKDVVIGKMRLGLDEDKNYRFTDIWNKRPLLSEGSRQQVRIDANGVMFIKYQTIYRR